MTINELLYDAIRYDEELLAYSIYWSIKNGVCKASDNAMTFDRCKVDILQVLEMKTRNELAMNVIKLYTMPFGDGNHLLVLAENESDAKGQYLKEINRLPNKIFDISHSMDKSFWFEDIWKYKSIREIKDETLVFPSTAMIFNKNN